MAAMPSDVDLTKIPFAPNPNGDPPNFTGGTTLQPVVLGTGIAFMTLSLTFVALRVAMSLAHAKRLHLDDYLCILGEASGMVYWFIYYEMQVKQGIAKHSWDIPLSAVTPTVTKGQIAAQISGPLAHAAVKSPIILLYIRLFGTLLWVRRLGYSLLGFVILLYVSYLIALLSFCIPASGQGWDAALIVKCNTTAPATTVIGVFAVIIDLIMFIMPFFIIVSLNTGKDKKLRLAIVFLIGFLVVVTSVVGLAYRSVIQRGSQDPIWNGLNISITAYTEIFGTVIVSCTPAVSTFWLGTVARTSIYNSIRSGLNHVGLRRSSQRSKGTAGPSFEHGEMTRQPAAFTDARRHTGHNVPLQSIQKSTLIVQQASAKLAGSERHKTRGGDGGGQLGPHQYTHDW